MKVAGVVLAAGGSSRLGEPKQLVHLGGITLLERAVAVMLEAACDPVVVVLGASAARISAECDLSRAWVVVNAGWTEGMGSSIRAGMELVTGFRDVSGAVVMTCDMPAVTASHLRLVMEGGTEIVSSRYAGRNGVPAYFPRASFAGLLELRGDMGARELLQGSSAAELEGGELDIDTQDGVERVRERFGA